MMRVREVVNRIGAALVALLCAMLVASPVSAEDGYDLWLRYAPLEPARAAQVREVTGPVAIRGEAGETPDAAREELERGLGRMLG